MGKLTTNTLQFLFRSTSSPTYHPPGVWWVSKTNYSLAVHQTLSSLAERLVGCFLGGVSGGSLTYYLVTWTHGHIVIKCIRYLFCIEDTHQRPDGYHGCK